MTPTLANIFMIKKGPGEIRSDTLMTCLQHESFSRKFYINHFMKAQDPVGKCFIFQKNFHNFKLFYRIFNIFILFIALLFRAIFFYRDFQQKS